MPGNRLVKRLAVLLWVSEKYSLLFLKLIAYMSIIVVTAPFDKMIPKIQNDLNKFTVSTVFFPLLFL